jgi:pilus assembly protein Flp/PilA
MSCYQSTEAKSPPSGQKECIHMLKRLLREEEGQGMVEYGLIIALVAIVVIVVLTTMGNKLKSTFQGVSDSLPTTTP